ncbi:MAG: tRNA preQ1(34) S-adenosylmethionine ribosyltransferase-isomerase QueA [bacterium]|nr:tRNA preQ1(34) S-adenosylmethionine ribosyltransferase-isomerase QueA [bacterium]
MKTEQFNFDLPERFIAQNPTTPRDHCKLFVYDCAKNKIFHKKFFELDEFLCESDVLVLNKSKVLPARVRFDGKELFILEKDGSDRFLAMVHPGRYFKVGREFAVGDLNCSVISINKDGVRLIHASGDLYQFGEAPLPPYIKNSDSGFDEYQTVYAEDEGSVAAPTAGLHFTDDLLKRIFDRGIAIEKLILHVGRGTFLPVSSENIEGHVMHEESYIFSGTSAAVLNKAKSLGSRVIAVGTTSVRVLESSYDNGFSPGIGSTDIFIYPGHYSFKAVDGLITNFHLPKSTLLMLVASFLENKGIKDPIDRIKKLYKIAMENEYRFYSFGDAMMII